MAAGTQLSVEEYLATTFRPDCDYVDGVVEERNGGEWDHAWIQGRLIAYFSNQFRESGLVAIPELRVQVRATRYRIPDLVVTPGKPNEQVLTHPPLLCIEILSKDDTISKMNERIRDYLEFGVPAVWVVDPREKRIWIYRSDGLEEAAGNAVTVDGTDITIPFSAIFD
jgi:Uma2 family endonuclease